jgi:predicted amidohydrolase
MTKLKVALAQMEVSLGQPEENFKRARSFISEAKASGAELVLLPELWGTGYDLKSARAHASQLNEGAFAQVAKLAAEFGIFVCGSLLEARGGECFNTQTVFTPTGDLLAFYSKAHLFGLMKEPEYLAPGNELTLANLPWGQAGMAVCYDLRFPEMFRAYALAGAQIILLSAEWPHPRLEHWRTLMRARAIENQVFVAATNCVGEGNGNVFFGHSMMLDPWGETIVEGDESESLLMAEVDLTQVAETRKRFPFFADRRTGLYALP